MIALIGARSGSKRIPGKNLRDLGGKPLIDWTLLAAYESNCFSQTYLSTDSAEVAYRVSADVWGLETQVINRPTLMASDDSLDLAWITHALDVIRDRDHKQGHCAPCSLGQDHMASREYCLLRPTSPFRDAATIKRAVAQWKEINNWAWMRTVVDKKGVHNEGGRYDSMRGIRKVSEHPNKMWAFGDYPPRIYPIRDTPQLYNDPTQTLFDAYVQTGALEIARGSTYLEKKSLSGNRVAGFVMEGPEALDINTEEDWQRAEAILDQQRQHPSSKTEERPGVGGHSQMTS